MGDQEAVITSVCASLARLQVRLLRKLPEARRMPNGVIKSASDSHWALRDLGWSSPWLDQLSPDALITNVVPRIALVQAHLLAMLETGTIEPRRVCLVLHHVCGGGTWSGMVLRLARRLGVTLAELPISEMHGPGALERDPLPRRAR